MVLLKFIYVEKYCEYYAFTLNKQTHTYVYIFLKQLLPLVSSAIRISLWKMEVKHVELV